MFPHHLANMIEPVLPSGLPNSTTVNRSVQPFFTAHGTVSSGMPGNVLSPNNSPFGWGIWALSNTCFLGPPESTTQTASPSVQPFCRGVTSMTDRPRYSVGNNRPHLRT